MFSRRPYAGPADLPALIDVRVAYGRTEAVIDWPSSLDLELDLAEMEHPQERAALWLDDDTAAPIAFAFIASGDRNLVFFSRPQAASEDLTIEIIRWGEARTRYLARTQAGPIYFQIRPRDNQPELIALLEKDGFQPGDWYTPRYVRSLSEPIPAAQVPTGFTIRPVAGEEEVEAYVDLHRAAFGTANMTVDYRLAFMRARAYIPDLDLVAVADDGTLAAFVVGSYDAEENARVGRHEGLTDPVGTRPAFQRQGLGQALLLEGFHRLKAHGIDTAVVGTGSWNIPMQRLAESVGFRLIHNILVYEKAL